MLKERVNQDEQLIVVVSAMGNTTDQCNDECIDID